MLPLALVMLGGALGSGCRYVVGTLALRALGPGWPWGTLAVNLVGGLLMGLLAGMLARYGTHGEPVRLFVGVGVLGGFTTFSAYSLEVVTMLLRGDVALGLGYALFSVLGATASLSLGLLTVRGLG